MPDRQGVWRGPQFLPLDERPYEILKKLFDLKGRSDPNILLEIAGSGENLNTLISRLRREIEPVKGAKIYLQNRRDQGYWLENSVPYSESH
jgi:DNA-binding response OmpR family regulator